MNNVQIGNNERASLDRPAWNISGWDAYKHLHRQGRSYTINRRRKVETHVEDGRILNFFVLKG